MATWWISGVLCETPMFGPLYKPSICGELPKKNEQKKTNPLWLWLRPTDSHLKKNGLCLAQDDQCSTVQPLGFSEKSGQDDPWTIDGCTRPVDKRQASRNQSRPEQSPGQSRRNQSRIASRCGCDFGVLKHWKVTNKWWVTFTWMMYLDLIRYEFIRICMVLYYIVYICLS